MRKETKEITYFQFSELSESAKQKAIEKLCDINVDYKWWESVYDDAEMVGIKITEFDIDRGSYCKGKFLEPAESVAQNIIREHGESCETYKVAKRFLDKYNTLNTELETVLEDESDIGYVKCSEIEDQIEELKEEFKREISEEYLSILRQEYEYRTSEEAIIESIESNQYEFDEEGNRI